MRWLRLLLVGACLAAAGGASAAGGADGVDRLAIASRLVADGLHDRAAAILDEVPEPDADDPDRTRYLTLRGMVALHLGQHAEAAVDLAAALADPEVDPLLNLHLAQARLSSNDPAGAIRALDAAGPSAEAVPGAWLLRGKAAQALDQPQAAWDALVAGRERFPAHVGLGRQHLLLMVELGLHSTAAREARRVLPAIGADATLWVTLGDALRRAGAVTGARWVLEGARLRFPESTDARVALARACLDADLPLCAGEVLQEAAVLDPVFASEAAECFRRAGAYGRATYLNGLVVDPAIKL
ncbi:MAG: putative Zn-dependent protease, partial [Myxococcota bacterium]